MSEGWRYSRARDDRRKDDGLVSEVSGEVTGDVWRVTSLVTPPGNLRVMRRRGGVGRPLGKGDVAVVRGRK